MKYWKTTTALGLATALAGGASATVLDTVAGPIVANEGVGNQLVIDVFSDTGDWIDNYNEPTESGTLYYSFDIAVNNNSGETGSGGFFTALQLFDGGTEALGVGNSWAATDWGYFGGNGGEGTLDTAQPIVIDQVERFAVRIDFNANADDDVTIWFNPVNGVAEGAQAASIVTTVTGEFHFSNVQARAGNGTGQSTFSNIVFGTEFEDVVPVPEPGSLALLGLGGLLIARRRRA